MNLRFVFVGDTFCDFMTMKGLACFADELWFIDLPALHLDEVDLSERSSEFRRIICDTENFHVHVHGAGAVGDVLNQQMHTALQRDRNDVRFGATFLKGLSSDAAFGKRAVRQLERFGVERPLILSGIELLSSMRSDQVWGDSIGRLLAADVSMQITCALHAAQKLACPIVTDSVWIGQLAMLRCKSSMQLLHVTDGQDHAMRILARAPLGVSRIEASSLQDIDKVRGVHKLAYTSWLNEIDEALRYLASGSSLNLSAAGLPKEMQEAIEHRCEALRKLVSTTAPPADTSVTMSGNEQRGRSFFSALRGALKRYSDLREERVISVDEPNKAKEDSFCSMSLICLAEAAETQIPILLLS